MRKKGDVEKALGGSELPLLEEENVDWERVWNRSVAGDALPASLRELRYVCTPPLLQLTLYGNIFFDQGRLTGRHSEGKRSIKP